MAQNPNLMSDEEKKRAIDALNKKGVKTHCPMCLNNNFILADGYFNLTIQANLHAGLIIGGPSIPTVAIICTNCGSVSHHALGALGLLQNTEGGK